MTEFPTNGGRESAERKTPVYEPVSATVPLHGGAEAQTLAYRLVSGTANLTTEVPEGTDIREGERVVRYVRSADAIIRIDPDGLIRRLDTEALKAGRIVVDKIGYLSEAVAEVGKPLSAMVARNPSGFVDGQLLANRWERKQLTQTPVTEVLIRTSRPTNGRSLPTTNTPARIGNPRQYVGR